MASAVLEAPLRGWLWPHDILIEGKPEPDPKGDVSSNWTRVMPGFFEILGDKIVMGRTITDEDNASTRPVAVINEALAKKFFGGENPIGQHFGPAPRKNAGMYEIVGVVSDINFGDGLQPTYFLPEAQATYFDEPETEEREVGSHYLYNVVVWAPGNPPGLELQVKNVLANIDPNLVVSGVESYPEVIHADLAQQNMIASLTWLFGAVGLVLAAVGLYGVTAYGVERRTSEIGVRIALGARSIDVLRMVLREGMLLAAIGIAIGIAASLALAPLIRSFLFGTTPGDPATLIAVASLLAAAALFACYIPARRAMRVDPMVALRHE
jgi:predicted permease